MKKPILVLTSVLLFTATLLPAPAVAQSAVSALPDEENSPLPPRLARRVAVGMTRGELTLAAGAPDVTLDASVWIYWDFRAARVKQNEKFDTLLVVFASNRVKLFKFVESASLRAFIAQRNIPTARSAIAKK